MFGLSFRNAAKKVRRSYPFFFCLRGELCWKARLTGTSGLALNFEILVVASLGGSMLQSCWASGVTVLVSRGAQRHTATHRNSQNDFTGNEGFANASQKDLQSMKS